MEVEPFIIEDQPASAWLDRLVSLLDSIDAAGKPLNFAVISEELLRAGVAIVLVQAATSTGSSISTEERSRSLLALQRMLQRNQQGCADLGESTLFTTLWMFVYEVLRAVTRPLQRPDPRLLSIGGLMAGWGAVNAVLAGSPLAQEKVCQEQMLLQHLSDTWAQTEFLVLGKMAVETLSHLTVPKPNIASPDIKSHSGKRCAVCLEGILDVVEGKCAAGSSEELLWCHFCFQALHQSCAKGWISSQRRCPFCRTFIPPNESVPILCDQLLAYLQSQPVWQDVPLSFFSSLLLVNLASCKKYARPLEALQSYGFFEQLGAAANAAERSQEWPTGSNCFPLLWKLSVTVERLVLCGFVEEMGSLLQPFVQALLQSSAGDFERDWYLRAVRGYLTSGGQAELVERFLLQAEGSSYEDACRLHETYESLGWSNAATSH